MAHLAIGQFQEVPTHLNVAIRLLDMAVAKRQQMVEAGQDARRSVQLARRVGDALLHVLPEQNLLAMHEQRRCTARRKSRTRAPRSRAAVRSRVLRTGTSGDWKRDDT